MDVVVMAVATLVPSRGGKKGREAGCGAAWSRARTVTSGRHVIHAHEASGLVAAAKGDSSVYDWLSPPRFSISSS
jgi:hypothetical protein